MSAVARQAIFCWAITFLFLVVLLFLVLGAPASSEGAGRAVGRLFAHTGLASLCTWIFARKKVPAWGAIRFGGLYVAMLIGIALVTAVGRVRAGEPPPFAISFADGRTVTMHHDAAELSPEIWATG